MYVQLSLATYVIPSATTILDLDNSLVEILVNVINHEESPNIRRNAATGTTMNDLHSFLLCFFMMLVDHLMNPENLP